MPDEPTSVLFRLFPSARIAAARLAIVIGAVTLAATAGVTAFGATSDARKAPENAATAPDPGSRAGLVPFEDTTERDAWQYVASLITPSNTPTQTPTSTPEPPPPTPTLAPARPGPAPPRAAAPARPAPPPPTSTPVPAPAAPAGLNTAPMGPYEQALFDATNARRVANGLPALRPNLSLVGIARIRSSEMAQYNYFAHVSPITGHDAFSLMDLYGVPFAWAGENLAKNNYPSAETVAVADEALWNSPPHRANILNTHYTDMGIALAVDASGMKYFTIIFTGP